MKNMFPNQYPADFEDARKAYGPAQNDSKSDSLKAWEQTKRKRMAAGAFGAKMILCCTLYNRFLDAENARRSKQRQADYPKAHMATWLRQCRWEGFMEEAEKLADAERFKNAPESPPTWDTEATKRLIREIGEESFRAYFSAAAIEGNPPQRLIVPKLFLANRIREKYAFNVNRALGGQIEIIFREPLASV